MRSKTCRASPPRRISFRWCRAWMSRPNGGRWRWISRRPNARPACARSTSSAAPTARGTARMRSRRCGSRRARGPSTSTAALWTTTSPSSATATRSSCPSGPPTPWGSSISSPRPRGGGMTGQAGAVRLGLARALQNFDPDVYRPPLRKEKLLTRDVRIVERKKPGKAKARKSFQWVKR
mmetsp:Transcript_61394/g.194348  ORF Transcript_61394/g.194348 Transcript_61394/m.194348 type:complete len:179 (-) Transcript_61394:57-593(-)